ncbi:MAG: carbohydrate kinase [bacterium]
MKKTFDITALGEILIDFTLVGMEGKNKLFQQNPGGAPANVLVAATKLGSTTAFIGKAGTDMHGRFLKRTLVNEGVNADGFLLDKDFFTTLAFVDINEFKERSFSFARKPGADTQLRYNELSVNAIKESKLLHVGSLSLTDEPVRSTTHYAINVARENDVLVSYDPNYRASLWESEDMAKHHMRSITADIMKLSDEETLLLTDVHDYEEASDFLLKKGVKIVVVTLGANGCYVCNKEGGVHVPGFKCKAVDTTGAGDAFWGAFLHKVTENAGLNSTLEELVEYARFANATASLCVESYGAIPAMPTIQEVNNRLK